MVSLIFHAPAAVRRLVLPILMLVIPITYVACSDSLPVADKKDNSSKNEEPKDKLCDSALVSRGGCLPGVYLEAKYYHDTNPDWTQRPTDALSMFTGFYQDGVLKSPTALAPLHLGRVDMGPEQPSNGFPIEVGRKLMTPNGDPINEYFTQHLRTSLILPSSLSEGNYQIAVISDDLAQLGTVTQHASYYVTSEDLEVDEGYPGHHPIFMSCIAEPIYLKADSKVDITIKHANVIGAGGLMLVMRPYSASNQLCGKLVNVEFVESYSDVDGTFSYDYLAGVEAIRTADGWEIVPDEALMISRELAETLYPQ